MKTLEEIKALMAAGETARAAEALKEVLAKDPGSLQAKMLYGTCCQLLGDEETFKRIYDELAPEMERREKTEPQSKTVSLWRKYHALWVALIVGGLVLVGLTGAMLGFRDSTTNQPQMTEERARFEAERAKKEAEVKRLLNDVQFYYENEMWKDVIVLYHQARQKGHQLTDSERQVAQTAYESQLRCLRLWITKTRRDIRLGRAPDRTLEDLENETRQLTGLAQDMGLTDDR